MAAIKIPTFTRFVSKIKINVITGCWEWQCRLAHNGYGRFFFGSRRGQRGYIPAHRFAYECLVGPIPQGMQIDHYLVPLGRCTERCCNPDHLRLATPKQNCNNRKKSIRVTGLCKAGLHKVEGDNAYLIPQKNRVTCKACRAIYKQKWTAENADRIRARQREYDAQHRDIKNRASRARYQASKEKAASSTQGKLSIEGAKIA